MRLILFFIIFLLVSCSGKNAVTDEKFKEALLKIHECEAYQDLKIGTIPANFAENCKTQALKDLYINRDDFDRKTEYYKYHPMELEALYDSLLLKYP